MEINVSHTHCQAAQSRHASLSLPKSVSEPTRRQKRKSTIAQHCIRAIAGEVVNSRSAYLINFGGGGQVIALKSATALILDRYGQAEKTHADSILQTENKIVNLQERK